MRRYRQRTFEILERNVSGSRASVFVNGILVSLILGSVLAVILESNRELSQAYGEFFWKFEVLVVAGHSSLEGSIEVFVHNSRSDRFCGNCAILSPTNYTSRFAFRSCVAATPTTEIVPLFPTWPGDLHGCFTCGGPDVGVSVFYYLCFVNCDGLHYVFG